MWGSAYRTLVSRIQSAVGWIWAGRFIQYCVFKTCLPSSFSLRRLHLATLRSNVSLPTRVPPSAQKLGFDPDSKTTETKSFILPWTLIEDISLLTVPAFPWIPYTHITASWLRMTSLWKWHLLTIFSSWQTVVLTYTSKFQACATSRTLQLKPVGHAPNRLGYLPAPPHTKPSPLSGGRTRLSAILLLLSPVIWEELFCF